MIENIYKKTYHFQVSTNSSILVAYFTGFFDGDGTRKQDIVKYFKLKQYNLAMFRDTKKEMCLNGINCELTNISDIKDRITQVYQNINAKKLVCIGSSSGGFSAILYGVLLNADVVHAFSPYTFFNKHLYYSYGLRYFVEKRLNIVNRLEALPEAAKPYMVLGDVLNRVDYDTIINVYYGEFHPRDPMYADHVSEYKNVAFHKYPSAYHSIVRYIIEKNLPVSLD